MLSAGRPRSDGERTNVDASEIVFWLTKKDGTMFLTASNMFAAGWDPSSSALITSTGDAESAAERSVRREPITTIDSSFSSLAAVATASLSCAKAGCTAIKAIAALPQVSHDLDVVLKCDILFSLVDKQSAMTLPVSLAL